jgi:hypothetical protein
MATPQALKTLARLLDTLPADERHEIIALLLDRRSTAPTRTVLGQFVEAPPLSTLRGAFASGLSGGEEHQLVTIRMPSDLHAQLRSWCSEHSFTMAAVIRGLVERFLEGQARQQPPPL